MYKEDLVLNNPQLYNTNINVMFFYMHKNLIKIFKIFLKEICYILEKIWNINYVTKLWNRTPLTGILYGSTSCSRLIRFTLYLLSQWSAYFQQGLSLGSCLTSPFLKPYYKKDPVSSLVWWEAETNITSNGNL